MRKYRRLAATLLLMALLGIVFAWAAMKYHSTGREAFHEQLMEMTERAALDIQRAHEADWAYLRRVSSLLSECGFLDDEGTGTAEGAGTDMSAKVNKAVQALSVPEGTGLLSRLEVLFPDDAGPGISGQPSFEEAAGAGAHLSWWDDGTPGRDVLWHCVPVERDGEIVAILCGSVDLSQIKDLLPIQENGGDWRWLMAEGRTGALLYPTGGNLEFDPVPEQTGNGPGWRQLLCSLSQEKAGGGAFPALVSGGGDGIYASYTPVGVEDWMLALTVPEGTAAAHMRIMPPSFFLFTGLLAAVFSVYFFGMLWDVKREKADGEKQLLNIQYMLDVEKELFGAHLQPERFSTALFKAAEFLTAENAFFWLPGNSKDGVRDQLWRGGQELSQERDPEILALFPRLFSILREQGGVLSHHMDSFCGEYPLVKKFVSRFGIQSLMLCPVTGWNGEPRGILGAYNMKYRWESTISLEQVAPSFCMAASHYENYQSLTRMGRLDSLTGLMNRNCYHAALEELEKEGCRSAACLYIDANGLHELNNRLGHMAGDAMLKAVADNLVQCFGMDQVFRIGGDEFVVLCRDQDQQSVLQGAEQVRRDLRDQGYGLSIGMECGDGALDMRSLVNAAEAAMRRDKKHYYQNHGRERQMRTLDQQVERMILEKQDADTFLSVLAPEFKGVYFVDLTHDTVRHLYIPPYFEELLRQSGDKFSEAMLLYAQLFAKPEYFEAFQQFCDERYLEQQSNGDSAPELLYEKLDGTWLKLRVLTFPKSKEGCRETLWIFANANPDPDGILGNAANTRKDGLEQLP